MSINLKDLYWATGFLEGEGCFSSSNLHPQIQAPQVQREPLERLQKILGGTIYTKRKTFNPKWQPCSVWMATGASAVGMMMTLYALMSPKRQEAIRIALTKWKMREPHNRYQKFCKKGHEFSNVTWSSGSRRYCTTCAAVSQARFRERHRQVGP